MYLSFDLTLPTKTKFAATTRRAIIAYLRDFGVPEPTATDVMWAVDEAYTNVVQHAFPGGDGLFQIRVDLRPEEVTIEICDTGVGFDALAQPVQPRGRLAVSGRGIEMMRRLVSKVELESPTAEGGTRVRLRQALGVAGDQRSADRAWPAARGEEAGGPHLATSQPRRRTED